MGAPQTVSLDNYGILCVAGKDAISFMQGYTTCDLAQLDNAAQLGAICNIQGRMLASFIAIQRGDSLLLKMDRALVPRIIEFLSKYIVFSKATMSDISDEWHLYGSPQCNTSANKLVRDDDGTIRIMLPWGEEIWSRKALEEASGDDEPWRKAEIDQGVAWVTEETAETFLPQMMNYHKLDAVDFEKGCYLGQEVVARAQYRGELKRKLHRIEPGSGLETGDGIGGGKVVASSAGAALAVLSNNADEPVEVELPDGQTVLATPL